MQSHIKTDIIKRKQYVVQMILDRKSKWLKNKGEKLRRGGGYVCGGYHIDAQQMATSAPPTRALNCKPSTVWFFLFFFLGKGK